MRTPLVLHSHGVHYRHSTALRPPTILAYEKRPNRRDNPARCEDGRPLEPYHSGCPSALKCGILCFSAKKKTQVAPRSSCYRQSPTFVRTKSRRACAEAALRAAATLYDRAKLRSSGRIVVSVLASRDRFEVLGVRGDINKSTTFGTEDKYNPFRSRNLSCATIPNPAEPHGNRNRAGTVNVAKVVGGGGRCGSL